VKNTGTEEWRIGIGLPRQKGLKDTTVFDQCLLARPSEIVTAKLFAAMARAFSQFSESRIVLAIDNNSLQTMTHYPYMESPQESAIGPKANISWLVRLNVSCYSTGGEGSFGKSVGAC
jgi:hypothetical protein